MRQMIFGWLLFFLLPIIGFGACLFAFDKNYPMGGNEFWTSVANFGVILFFGGPVLGLAVVIFAWARKRGGN